jgi:ABC-type phosphate/phosphonate transport system substrate-binding protein
MIASLPMYDFPHIRGETDTFWQALAAELKTSTKLERREDFRSIWTHPDLAFSQTCGFPLTHELRERVHYVATPHYTADGCDGPHYRSLVFARDQISVMELAGKIAAVNTADSMSGMLALKAVIATVAKSAEFFTSTCWTGSHLASLKAVQDGMADVCAIDCVTVAHVRRSTPELLAGLHEIARGPSVPGLPYISAGSVERVRTALQAVFDRQDTRPARDALLLSGFSVLPDRAYDVIYNLEAGVGWVKL